MTPLKEVATTVTSKRALGNGFSENGEVVDFLDFNKLASIN